MNTMKKVHMITLGFLFFALILTTSMNADTKADVEKVIKASYFNELLTIWTR